MTTEHIVGSICVALALILDISSYWKQIAKILKTKKSNQVSSSSYLYKIAKGVFAILGLLVYSNWVGFGMEVVLLLVYIGSLIVIMRFKPKGWTLFGK
jgi:uncharacterized protein with PQ loop repeat